MDNLAILVHELSNLLDGTWRCLALARESLTASGEIVKDPQIDSACRQIETAWHSIERMADLVHGAMQGPAVSLGSPAMSASSPITLHDAISHAFEVLAPIAKQNKVALSFAMPESVGITPAGPLYSVLLNGIKNAVESIASSGGLGRVQLDAYLQERDPDTGKGPRRVVIEIRDDGRGIAKGVPPARVFDYGYTTKTGGTGIGLSIARSIVEQQGGQIELFPRTDRDDTQRPGAVLRIALPLPGAARARKP